MSIAFEVMVVHNWTYYGIQDQIKLKNTFIAGQNVTKVKVQTVRQYSKDVVH